MSALSLAIIEARPFDWIETQDGDPVALAIYRRHYSAHRYRDGRRPRLFVGPGQKMVLLTLDQSALYVWRKFRSMDEQEGVNCSVFRNEGEWRSSTLIRLAMRRAWVRWPSERLYTYVDSRKIQSSNPGYCFKVAGWTSCGRTKDLGLHILEVRP